MTYEQTREQFLLAWNSNAYINMCTSDDMKNVIEALDKQIPKTPIVWENRYYYSPTPNDDWGYECPFCGNRDIDYPEHHCTCGQALDWRVNSMSDFFDDAMQGLLEAATWDYMNPPEEKKEEAKLKRCPFCGGEVEIISFNEKYAIRCTGERCLLSYGTHPFYHKDKLIEAWNTRKPVKNVLDRLKEMFKHHNATKIVQRLVLETVENEL